MENSDTIIRDLLSEDVDVQEQAVKSILENGDINIVKPLLDILKESTSGHSTESLIVSILSDIRDVEIQPLIIHAIEESSDAELRATLLRMTWESSLDYTAYLDIFTDILLNDEFAPAFEASTTIENMVHNLSDIQISSLQDVIKVMPSNRSFLVENIVTELSTPKDVVVEEDRVEDDNEKKDIYSSDGEEDK